MQNEEKEESDVSVERNPNALHVVDVRTEADGNEDFEDFDRAETPFDDQEADDDEDEEEESHEDNVEESDGPLSLEDLVLFLHQGIIKKEEKADVSVAKNFDDGFWDLRFNGNESITDPADSTADDAGSISVRNKPIPLSEEEIGYFNEY